MPRINALPLATIWNSISLAKCEREIDVVQSETGVPRRFPRVAIIFYPLGPGSILCVHFEEIEDQSYSFCPSLGLALPIPLCARPYLNAPPWWFKDAVTSLSKKKDAMTSYHDMLPYDIIKVINYFIHLGMSLFARLYHKLIVLPTGNKTPELHPFCLNWHEFWIDQVTTDSWWRQLRYNYNCSRAFFSKKERYCFVPLPCIRNHFRTATRLFAKKVISAANWHSNTIISTVFFPMSWKKNPRCVLHSCAWGAKTNWLTKRHMNHCSGCHDPPCIIA